MSSYTKIYSAALEQFDALADEREAEVRAAMALAGCTPEETEKHVASCRENLDRTREKTVRGIVVNALLDKGIPLGGNYQ